MTSPRLAAARTVGRVLFEGAYSNIELANGFPDTPGKNDRALYGAMAMTVLERKNTLDYVIGRFVRKTPDTKVLCLLYVGAAQLLYLDRIPVSAACDETVKAANVLTDSRRAGFVNGVLRNIASDREHLLSVIEGAPDTVKYSLDKSISRLIRRQYPADADDIMKSAFVPQSLCLRTNTLKNTTEDLCAYLAENGIVTDTEDGFVFADSRSADKALSLLGSGRFYIQGAGSQYAVKLLGAEKGMTVIDVCACPGGKSLGAAIDMENTGKIISMDIHGSKFGLLEASAKTLGVSIIETREYDSTAAAGEYRGIADRVICDVPCSSLGVIPAKPEIRYKDVSALGELYETQRRILDSASSYVKPGGVLVYSTCTVNENENRLRVNAFLAENPSFTLAEDRQFTLYRGAYDGFYAAKLIKNVD